MFRSIWLCHWFAIKNPTYDKEARGIPTVALPTKLHRNYVIAAITESFDSRIFKLELIFRRTSQQKNTLSNLHGHHITSTLPIPCGVRQWICCNIRPLVADNTFKFELLFKRTSQPKITLTSTEIILHLLVQSPVLFKSLPFLLINYTITSTNIIFHILSFSSM